MELGPIRAANAGNHAPHLGERFRAVRALSEALAAPLSDADATLQSMDDASPAKWHLAHTTWFFETFVLRDQCPDYRRFDESWPFLFNSYYEAEGERIARSDRGLLSRPSLEQVLAYRAHVDAAMERRLAELTHDPLIELGLAHEQQHQELLLTDIKHALWSNPLGPEMWPAPTCRGFRFGGDALPEPPAAQWHEHPGGVCAVGHGGEGFAFDNEGPRHSVMLEPFALAPTLVTNREWEAFIAAGGYRTPRLWLSDGWAWVQRERIAAPLFWRGEEWFSHTGWIARDPEAPVAHISYYEADAYATWAGARLPTEHEWEAIGQRHDPAAGLQLDDDGGACKPQGGEALFGDAWQWTRSAYLPYPRFRPAAGAVGEYNGKFMSGQFVLKGGSCATPRGHCRASYRNFFYPHQRWQFTGVRLARDL